jgi:hypothetical protein
MPNVTSSKRHFKVVIGKKEHGLYLSSSPLSAARKAVSKLCATDKKKKVEFSLREITRGSIRKTYGPYLGYIEKLKVPIQLKGRLVEYKPNAKLIKKTGVKKGGYDLKRPTNITKSDWNKVESGMYSHPERIRQSMFVHFSGKMIPEHFNYEEEKYMSNYARCIPKIKDDDQKWNEFRETFEKETDSALLKLQKKVRECNYFPFKPYIETPTKCDDYLYLVGKYGTRDREYMKEYCHYMSLLSNNINNRTTEQEIYELKLGCDFKDYENVSELQKVVDQHMRHDATKVNKIDKFRVKLKPIHEIEDALCRRYPDIMKVLEPEERRYISEYYYHMKVSTNQNSLRNFKTINDRYRKLGETRLAELKRFIDSKLGDRGILDDIFDLIHDYAIKLKLKLKSELKSKTDEGHTEVNNDNKNRILKNLIEQNTVVSSRLTKNEKNRAKLMVLQGKVNKIANFTEKLELINNIRYSLSNEYERRGLKNPEERKYMSEYYYYMKVSNNQNRLKEIETMNDKYSSKIDSPRLAELKMMVQDILDKEK